jgi:hypothetical protein
MSSSTAAAAAAAAARNRARARAADAVASAAGAGRRGGTFVRSRRLKRLLEDEKEGEFAVLEEKIRGFAESRGVVELRLSASLTGEEEDK